MTRYHVNRKNQVRPCYANVRPCVFGEPYSSFIDAEKGAEVKNIVNNCRVFIEHGFKERDFFRDRKIPEDYADINAYMLEKKIRDYAESIFAYRQALPAEVSDKLHTELEAARHDLTPAMIALTNHPDWEPVYVKKDLETVGSATKAGDLEAQSKEWVENRHNSFGGSQAHKIISARDKLKTVAKTNIDPIDPEKMAALFLNSGTPESYRGAMALGSAWESYLRNEYAKKHPEFLVIESKSQYSHPDRPWQQVNFDGILCDPETGVPVGILEIKTGNSEAAWDNGPPQQYRTQALYYLNATGLETAVIYARISDMVDKEFVIHRDDPVYPRKSPKNMEHYVKTVLEPLWETVLLERKKRGYE